MADGIKAVGVDFRFTLHDGNVAGRHAVLDPAELAKQVAQYGWEGWAMTQAAGPPNARWAGTRNNDRLDILVTPAESDPVAESRPEPAAVPFATERATTSVPEPGKPDPLGVRAAAAEGGPVRGQEVTYSAVNEAAGDIAVEWDPEREGRRPPAEWKAVPVPGTSEAVAEEKLVPVDPRGSRPTDWALAYHVRVLETGAGGGSSETEMDMEADSVAHEIDGYRNSGWVVEMVSTDPAVWEGIHEDGRQLRVEAVAEKSQRE